MKNSKRLMFLIVAIPASALCEEVVRNGSFSNGTSGWTISVASGSATAQLSTNDARGDSASRSIAVAIGTGGGELALTQCILPSNPASDFIVDIASYLPSGQVRPSLAELGMILTAYRDPNCVREGYITEIYDPFFDHAPRDQWSRWGPQFYFSGVPKLESVGIEVYVRASSQLTILLDDISVYAERLVISTIQPNSGLSSSPPEVLITGSQFGSDVQVFFGAGICLDLRRQASYAIRCRPPAAAPGVVDVRVMSGGATFVAPGAFTYTEAPVCHAPVIVAASESARVPHGSRATLTVEFTGTDPSVIWYQGDVGQRSFIAGASTSIETPPVVTPMKYWAEVTNTCGSAATGAIEVIPYHPRRRIVSHPFATGTTGSVSDGDARRRLVSRP